MGKYRKKPVVIEAVQYKGQSITILDFCTEAECASLMFRPAEYVVDRKVIIATLEGNMEASYGDWIIRGVNGELYPCKPDIFAKTYEPVDDAAKFGGAT